MIGVILGFFLKLYLFSNILQQSFYEYKNVFKFMYKRCLLLYLSTILLIINYFYFNVIILVVALVLIVLEYLYFLINTKIYLKFTKRVIRLWVLCILIVGLFYHFNIFFLVDLFTIFILLISDFLIKPLEFLINKKHLINAQKKLNKNKNIKIAVTGSYGKTSTKHYLSSVLKSKYLVSNSPKSYNTPLGIAMYINNNNLEFDDFIILEFGARRIGDIKELANLYKYDVALITGIGEMHIDTFKSLENIIKEKMSLLEFLNEDGYAILNYENQYIREFKTDKKKYTYGFDYGDFRAKNIVISIDKTTFDLYINNDFIKKININLLGRQSVLNVMPAIIFCYLYDISYESLDFIESVTNRLSVRKIGDYYILDDAYNSNILGAKYALEVLKTHNGMKVLITPGFVEMDKIMEELALMYAKEIVLNVDLCILIKNKFTNLMYEHLKEVKEVVFVKNFEDGFELFLKRKKDNSILLIENDLPDAF